jgi:heavy metal sensor kinase
MIRRFATIRVRLTLWYVFLLGTTLLGFGMYLLVQMHGRLLEQIDISLQVATAQTLGQILTNEDGVLRFMPQLDSTLVNDSLSESGVGARLVSASAEVLDGFGSYEELPIWVARQPSYATLVTSLGTWRLYSYTIQFSGDRVSVWLQVSQSLSEMYTTLERLAGLMLLGTPFVLLTAAGGGLFLADRALRPVERITHMAASIDGDRLNQRIAYNGPPDELAQLAQTFDIMIERLDRAFEAERRFTADASHEIRTPLTIIKGHLDVGLMRPRSVEEYQSILQTIRAENDRLIRLANSLMLLTRLDAAPTRDQFEWVDMNDLLSIVGDQVGILADEKQQQVMITLSTLPRIKGNPDNLIRLFMNLLENAVKYTPSRGQIRLSADHEPSAVVVRIADNGPGIPAEKLPHLFERFYRANEHAVPGAGLGLAIAASIAREHGGSIQVESECGSGSVFTVRLPRKK